MRCERIQLVDGTGSISTDENSYDTDVNVTCNAGYKINDQTSLVVNCTATETWSFEPVSCQRKTYSDFEHGRIQGERQSGRGLDGN